METEAVRGLNASIRPREWLGAALRRFAERDGRGYPDWALRYEPIVRRLQLRRGDVGLVLEVGANENGLGRFCPQRIVAVDCAIEHLRAARAAQGVMPVVADMAHLPFATGGMDVVVSVDTLEHIQPASREASVGELTRVLKATGRGAIAFPSGEASEAAEKNLLDEAGRSLRWFDEHRAYGLPDDASVAEQCRGALAATHRVSVGKNANLRVWRLMWLVLLQARPRRLNALCQVALRLATPMLSRAHWGRCYRAIVWLEPRHE